MTSGDAFINLPLSAVVGLEIFQLGATGALMGAIRRNLSKKVDGIEETLKSCATTSAVDEIKRLHSDNSRAVVDVKRRLHEANQALLLRILEKIDQNEGRNFSTRHEIRDSVHTVAMAVAELKVEVKNLIAKQDRE